MQLRQLNTYLHRLNAITSELTTVYKKDRKLAEFMSELESTEEYRNKDADLMEVYRRASRARTF